MTLDPKGKVAFKNLAPMLSVESVERTRDFYCHKLGFTCLNTVEWEGRLGWCLLGSGGPRSAPDSPWRVELMFSAAGADCTGQDRATRKGVILYLHPEDVVALHALYTSRGVAVSDLRVTFYHMKEFEVEDPDGYQLWFGQETTEPATPDRD
jgi:uncharacterized glyoxalase superfamily protein PhnB